MNTLPKGISKFRNGWRVRVTIDRKPIEKMFKDYGDANDYLNLLKLKM
jgi:hypothetical protein